MSNTAKKITPADVVAKAEEEKLVVPAQKNVEITDEGVTVVEEQDGDQSEPKLTLIEGGKRTLKNKLGGVITKAGQHKKALLGTIAVVGTITLVAVKYAKNKAEEILDENATEEIDSETTVTADESAV